MQNLPAGGRMKRLMRDHQCADCMVGQGRRCRCADAEPPSLAALLLLLLLIGLQRLGDAMRDMARGCDAFVIGCVIAIAALLVLVGCAAMDSLPEVR
jgi:hypothetical protein